MEQLGHFRILSRIGAGGMGEVYRARDEKLQRDVAIKVLPPESFADDAARARLMREARSAAALNHPNICVVHEVGEVDGQAFIAMECVEGTPLDARLTRGPLPVSDVIRYGIQLADALAHAHERDIVHRDLKPGNVIIGRDERLKVLDFGLAKRIDNERSRDVTTTPNVLLTEPGTVLGTPAYMAPEQLRGQPADARSDLWAFGVILYEMATGRRPFEGQTWPELSAAILTADPPALPAVVPAELAAVVARCLAKDPGQRYQRAGEVRAVLEALQSGVVSSLTPLRSGRARARWLLAATAVLALLLLAIAVLVSRSSRSAGVTDLAIRSIAVLPLANLSGNPEHEYLADGLTDALIADLGRLGGLRRVIARTSVMRFKGSTKPLREIARELDVDVLLTGAVVRSGDRVRITAELIDPKSDRQLWSEVYERDVRDVLALQNDAARAIAARIGHPASPGRVESAPPISPQAHDAYLKGKFHLEKRGPQNFETAIRYFDLALQREPRYALAHVGLSRAWLALAAVALYIPPAEGLPKAKAAALRALEIDDSLAEGHLALAEALFAEWDWSGAERAFIRARSLGPNHADVCSAGLRFALFKGERPVSDEELDRCVALDPLSPEQQFFRGKYYLDLGRTDDAVEQFERQLRLDPEYLRSRFMLAIGYYRQGRYDDSIEARKIHSRMLGHDDLVAALEKGKARGGFRGAMMEMAAALEKRSRSEKNFLRTTTIAECYLLAGEKERALDWLEKAYEERVPLLSGLGYDARWAGLRDEPRFRELLRRLNAPLRRAPAAAPPS